MDKQFLLLTSCRFWDQETWMYPGMLLLHPDTAASLLEYRVKRLAGGRERYNIHARTPTHPILVTAAREKALSYSPPFGGAMFPWESAFTGAIVAHVAQLVLSSRILLDVLQGKRRARRGQRPDCERSTSTATSRSLCGSSGERHRTLGWRG